MKTKFVFVLLIEFLLVTNLSANPQKNIKIDSLKRVLDQTDIKDKNKVLNELCWALRNSNIHEAIQYGLQSVELSKQFSDYEDLTRAYGYTGVAYRNLGNYSEALDFYFKGLQLAEKYNYTTELGYAYINIGNLYIYQELYNDAKAYIDKAMLLAKKLNNKTMEAYCNLNFGRIFLHLKKYDKAHEYLNESLRIRQEIRDTNEQAVCYMYIGEIYLTEGDYDSALQNFFKSKDLLEHQIDFDLLANLYIKFSKVYLERNDYKNALINAEKSLAISKSIQSKLRIRNAYITLVSVYKKLNNFKIVSEYYEYILSYNDSLFNSQINEKISYIKFIEKQNFYEKKISEQIYKDNLEINKQKQFRNFFILITAILIIITLILYAFFRSKKNHYLVLSEKNKQISEQKLELEDLVDKYYEAKNQADEANRLKSEFLANMSHEIRTPMNAIVGFSDLLRQKVKNPEHLSYVDKIILSSSNLLNLINEILDLSKIEAGKLSIQNEATDLRSILKEVKEIFSESVASKDLLLNIEVDPNFPEIIQIDSVRLRQILLNLVSNGIKFTNSGSVTIKITTESVVKDTLNFNISVIDTGIGIPENQIEVIFEVFRQAEGQDEKIYGGTGLGLSITKNLVEMMNGTITVKSITGKGSTFNISFTGIEFSNESLQTNSFIQPASIVIPHLKILNADDSEMNRALVKSMLEDEKFEVFEAADGDEVLALFQKVVPDIILLDIRMPKKDGFETAKIIRSNVRFEHIPIIALTANIMDSEIQKIKAYFDDYLSKPITKRDLMTCMAKYVKVV